MFWNDHRVTLKSRLSPHTVRPSHNPPNSTIDRNPHSPGPVCETPEPDIRMRVHQQVEARPFRRHESTKDGKDGAVLDAISLMVSYAIHLMMVWSRVPKVDDDIP
ncbi:MAG: hypothetical protein OXC68_04375 [Aestuariivita sp.]|nr:hypothetical protein [Aestuariivita sp.]